MATAVCTLPGSLLSMLLLLSMLTSLLSSAEMDENDVRAGEATTGYGAASPPVWIGLMAVGSSIRIMPTIAPCGSSRSIGIWSAVCNANYSVNSGDQLGSGRALFWSFYFTF